MELWERLNNPDFKLVEFDGFKAENLLKKYYSVKAIIINKKGLLRRQTHLLWLLHLKRMANEFIYTIIICYDLSSLNKKR